MNSPHILLILTDQQRADCLSCAGHPMLKTPNMDRLAAEGVRFSNCFTTSPLCVPARISLAMGLYPHNSNIWQNDAEVPTDADTYIRRLRDKGYHTASIGKNHLYSMEGCDLYANEENFKAIGFDYIEDMSGTWGVIDGKDVRGSKDRGNNDRAKSVYTDHLKSLGLLKPLQEYLKKLDTKPDRQRRFIAEPLPIPAEHYIDSFIADRVEKHIEQYSEDKPTFMYVGFQGPHEPWDAPQEYVDQYDIDNIPDPILEKIEGDWLTERSRKYHKYAQYFQPERPRALKEITASYFGKIALIDDSIGRILAAYERKGWLDNTVVLFASDHGEMLGDHARLSKSMFYESALRVPLIVRMPGNKTPGKVHDGFVETVDIHATLLEAAGCEPWKHQDSISLLPLMNGTVDKIRNDVLSEVHVHYMLRTENWKIVVGKDGRTLQLFDLKKDPLEQVNLCEHPDYKEQEMEMRSRLLMRIVRDTFRDGAQDPELSSHIWEPSKITIIKEERISSVLDLKIKEGLRSCFPKSREFFSRSRAWHGAVSAFSVVVEEHDAVVAHVGVVDRVIKAGDSHLRVGGVQNVFVLHDYRGKGISDKIMTVAMDEAGRLGFDAGLLFCLPALAKVYARCGWKLLSEDTIIRVNEEGEEVVLPGENIAMFYPLKIEEFPAGTIHLQGNDW